MSLEKLLLRDPQAVLRELDRLDSAGSLAKFMRLAWPVIEPGQPYVHGWHLDAIAEHLEAVSNGEILRLLINVPPGMMKSLATGVFWPAWLWGPKAQPHKRILGSSYSEAYAIRDAARMRNLVASEWYQERWGDIVQLTKAGEKKFENTAMGWREGVPFSRMTGGRGDIVIIDDPHSTEMAESDAERARTKRIFLESVPTRLNNPETSAIVVIMQRLHEEDVSGTILSEDLGYESLILPMEFDPEIKCYTSIGFEDPRTEPGELLFPERFPQWVVDREKKTMGAYATAGQFQQQPTTRGGVILQRTDWRLWDEDEYPPFDYVVASLDPAYTEKEENDYSAMTVWGVWNDAVGRVVAGSSIPAIVQRDAGVSRIMLMYAWQDRMELHGRVTDKLPDETNAEFLERQKKNWGLVQKVADTCKRWRVDRLLIESKASGLSVAQEIKRLYANEGWGITLVDPKGKDKVARAWAIQHLFADGLICAPNRSWADMVIDQCAMFPRAKHDDLVDSSTQALKHLRDIGFGQLSKERAEELYGSMQHRPRPKPLYRV